MSNRCEDYPCCGHTDGLGCNYTPDYTYIYAHLGCDHEAGIYECDEGSSDWCHDCSNSYDSCECEDDDNGIDYAWEDEYMNHSSSITGIYEAP